MMNDISDNNKSINETEKPNNQKKLIKRIGVVLFAVFCGAAVLITALKEFGPASTAERVPISSINLNYLLLALAAFVLAMAAESAKYYFMIFDVTGGKKLPWLAYKVAIYGKYYDNITPFGSGGQPFQIYHLQKTGIPLGDAAALPIAGFTSSQIAFVILALTMFIANGGVTKMVGFRIAAYAGLLFYLFVPLTLILFAIFPNGTSRMIEFVIKIGWKIKIVKNVSKTVDKIKSTLIEYRAGMVRILSKKKTFARVLLLSFIYQIGILSIPFFVIIAFGGSVNWFDVFTMTLLVYASVTVVPTPGNAGAAEGAFYTLFQTLSQANLFWAMLVWRFFVFYLVIIVGFATSSYEKIKSNLSKRDGKAAKQTSKEKK
ncbi:MAG: flippase-like domain-containing protein [Clostridia bacterium]|nr:flippase-like domain-containing protein [Clostridia bacterium]